MAFTPPRTLPRAGRPFIGQAANRLILSPSPSPTSTPTATRASIFAASESPSPSQSTIPLPNSTIVSIGLGFVAFGVGLFLLTLLLRVHQVHRYVQRERAEGRTVRFRDQWDRMGGWWGYFVNDTGDGRAGAWARGGGIGIGAGGWGREDVFMARVFRELERRRLEEERAAEMDKWEVPKMWEVDIDAKIVDAPIDDWAECKPISLCSDTHPTDVDPPDPSLSLSLLILLPQPPVPPPLSSSSNDGLEDPPDVVLGIATVLPFVGLANPSKAHAGPRSSSSDSLSGSEITLEKKAIGKTEIDHVEDAEAQGREDRAQGGAERGQTVRRRAIWVRQGEQWRVEGLMG